MEVAARNALGESRCATPAVVENTFYLRSDEHLWSYEECNHVNL
jgi:hypothetical protein